MRAGPHPDVTVLTIRNSAGRADRTVHLVGPDISPCHRLCGGGNGSVDVALVDQGPRRRGIGTERSFDVLQIGKRRRRLPGDFELRSSLDRVLLTLGDDTDKITDPDDGDQPRNIADRSLVDRDQAGADESTGIDAGVGRAYDAAVEHAGYAHVMNINEFAGSLRRKVGARHRLPDNGVGIDGLYRNVIRQFKADDLAGNQFAVADAAVIPSADQTVFYREVFH